MTKRKGKAMVVQNADIARIFDQVADLLEVRGDNPFRVRAYRNAARTVGEWGESLSEVLSKTGHLPRIPGVGADLDGKIREILTTGRLSTLEKLREEFPPHLTELLSIPGLGPKKVRAFYEELGIQDISGLHRALLDHRIAGLRGFGPRSEERLIKSVEARLAKVRRYKLATAAQYARPLVTLLKGVRGVREVVVAGSFRRMKETVGDLDLLVTTEDPEPVVQRFVSWEGVERVLASGSTKASVVLSSGIQVDLRVMPPASFGAALVYFTGSRAHNIALRRLAQDRGLKINEYGVFRGKSRVAGETEESVYSILGLSMIPPELREDRGEIQRAARGPLPALVTLPDLKGDLHAHTRWTDGHNSVREMAEAARDRGWSYLAITDHSRRLTMVHGLGPNELREQGEEIDRLRPLFPGLSLLRGIEVDILEDGQLDLPDQSLSSLDLVVGAVHSKFSLSRADQTARILRAMDHPRFNILAHPTGRLIGEREPYDLDMLRVLRKARERQVALEVNAHPERLDLTDVYCRMAKDEGVLLAINSDAHAPGEFDNLEWGVGQARRGWIEASDVLNARPLEELLGFLRKKPSKARPEGPTGGG
jgi:DNA polymerase (family 10)